VTDSMNLYDKDTMAVTVHPDPGFYSNTAPMASVGDMILLLELPDNELILPGAAEDLENNIMTYKWTKISGPDSFIFQNENLRNTRVTGLEKGTYVFELTVTDLGGLFDTARVQVIVGELPALTREIIINNLTWDYDCCIGFKIDAYIPAGSFFKPYIQRENDSEWTPAISVSSSGYSTGNFLFVYSLHESGQFWVWRQDFTTRYSVNIKIVY